MGKFDLKRPGSACKPKPIPMGSRRLGGIGMISTLALNKATKALSSVAAETQKGNIKVVVRVRPANDREMTVSSRIVVHAVDSHMVVFDPPDDPEATDFYYKGIRQQNFQQGKRHKDTKLAFDNVYGPQSTTSQIFEDVINPMLDTLLSGYNCSVFAYGATGSGKTYTMIGSKDNPGLTFMTVMDLYRRLAEMENDYESEVVVSYLEVYNETIRDLLHTTAGDLQIREDDNGVVVANLTTHKPKDSTALLELLAQGNSVRSQHPTDHNAESSRSHAAFMVYIKLRSRFTELTNKFKSAKLVMVDLAGSEKGAATGFQGQRFREGASINKSLLSLGNCINALADGKKHIPYRDSKLTRILKDALGGNCKTVMIANVSPSNLSYEDSYNTLRYADRAKRIKVQVRKNTMSVSACLTQYTKVVDEMRNKIESLEKELSDLKSKCKCNVSKVDAASETERVNSSNQAMDTDIAIKSLPPPVEMDRVNELIDKKKELTTTLCEAMRAERTASTKLRLRTRRIETIQKLKSTDARGAQKHTAKFAKQLDTLQEHQHRAHIKRTEAQQLLNRVEEELKVYETMYPGSSVAVPASEFIQLKNLKADNHKLDLMRKQSESLCTTYQEEWQKSENLLGEGVGILSSHYLLSKHHGKVTKLMEESYEDFVSTLSGTKVQWSNDDDATMSESSGFNHVMSGDSVGNRKNQSLALGQTFVMGSSSPQPPSPLRRKNTNEVFEPKRPGTPPRPPGRSLSLQDYMDDSSIEDSPEITLNNLLNSTYTK